MGPGRLQPLVSAVDSVELSMEGDGVMAAVQARLARRQLPRLNKDGLVEYSIPLPASATTRGSPPSADIEWIMAAAGGGTSSARERTHSEQNRELSQPTSARSSSGHHENIGPTPAPRRYHSAGKNRKKLPWEELPNEDDGVELEKLENSNQRNHPNSAPSHKRPNEDKPPLKARHTWSEVDDNIEIKPFRYPKGSSGSRDQSPDSGSGAGGSYRQIHLNKLKRERERPSFNAYTAGLGSKTDDSGISHSAPSTDRDWPGWKYTNGTSFTDIFGETDILASSTNKKRGVGRQDSKDRDDKYFPSFGGTSKDEEFLRKSLASTWPNQDKEPPPIPRKRVDPLSEPTTPSTVYPPEWPGSEESPKKSNKVNQAAIPLKPTLARSANRKTKHVPPLALNDKGSRPLGTTEPDRARAYLINTKKDDDFDDLEDSDDDFNQMQNSLQSLRNSAARKRAARKADHSNGSSRTTSRSPSPPFEDSGHYSVLYDSLDPSPKSTPKKKGKKSNESPFSNKPRVARLSTSEKESPEIGSKDLEPNPFEFSPTGGVTFRDKVKSDVSVVGQGYGKQDSGNVSVSPSQILPRTDSPPIPTHAKANARERRRQTKGNVVSPLTMASLTHPGAVDNEDLSEDVGVVGKGVFGTKYAPPTQEYGNDKSKRSKERKDSETGRSNLPTGVYGVYGVGMKQTNSLEDNDSSDEDPASISMSKATKDKMAKKQLEMEQKKAEKQAEKEKRQKEREIWQKQQEREREKAREQQREKLKEIKSFTEEIPLDSLTISGSNSSNTPPKSKTVIGKPPVASTPKKKLTKSPSSAGEISPTKGNTSLNQSLSMQHVDDDGELKPFPNPDVGLRDALRFLQNEHWEVKIDGLTYVRRLAVFHPDTLNSQLHTVIVAVLTEVKNLRSSVARAAISTLAEMFTQLRVSMDKDLDQLCKGLLQKAAESNGFIREDVDKSLAAMVNSVTPQRALVALITGGASHRNVAVRKTCAQFLVEVVEKMGPGRLLSGIKDVTDKILPATAQFCVDPSLKLGELEYYGRKIMYQLMNHEDFEKLLIKYVAQKDVRQVKEVMERLRTRCEY
ncbi:TOG array regulator of axonemal microtubules protein 1-like [Ptychodera flava]|uniref:TOG array regulator of axonemal microtubules protein 1-like n=1 Tax=Ptychodera flava TaxID=63121 RepID=UPI00396AB041